MARTKNHPGSIRAVKGRAGVWRIRLCNGTKLVMRKKDGVEVQVRVGEYSSFTVHGTKTDAINKAVREQAAIEAQQMRFEDGLPDAPTFSGLIDQYRAGSPKYAALALGAKRSYNDSFKALTAFFVGQLGNPVIDRIRRAHVQQFLRWRSEHRVEVPRDTEGNELLPQGVEGVVSPHTVARDYRVLKLLYNYAVGMSFLESSPVVKDDKPGTEKREYVILTPKEYGALLNAAQNPMLYTYIMVLGETGARADTEALALEWSDVDLQAGKIHIRSTAQRGKAGRRTKSGKSRHVPTSPRLRQALQEHAAAFRMVLYDGQRSPYLFHHTHTSRRSVAGQRVQSFRNAFERAAERADVPEGFVRHDLRHRRCTTWLAAGHNPVHVMKAMGHANLATTMMYEHMKDDDIMGLAEDTPMLRSTG